MIESQLMLKTPERAPIAPQGSEMSPIFRSPRIRQFLSTVKPGQNYALLDMDQNIFPRGIDSEETAFERFSLIQDKKTWEVATADLVAKGGDAYLVEGRGINLFHYPRTVTAEISKHTGIAEGTVMSEEVMRAIGRTVGENLVAAHFVRTPALQTFLTLERFGVETVMITATPRPLAEGVMETVSTAYGFKKPVIIGTEDRYNPDGSVEEELFIYGDTKTDVVKEIKKRGGVALVGSGDKYTTSDVFIHECKIKGHTDKNAPDGGDSEWARINAEIVRRLVK